MRFEELLSLRQSCRNYDAARPVAEEDILTCARAMRLAPSACNAQPYHITVCREIWPCRWQNARREWA